MVDVKNKIAFEICDWFDSNVDINSVLDDESMLEMLKEHRAEKKFDALKDFVRNADYNIVLRKFHELPDDLVYDKRSFVRYIG